MPSDVPQEDPALDLLERGPEGIGRPSLPDALRSLHALDPERRMQRVLPVAEQRFVEPIPVLCGELLRGPLEARRALEDHRFRSAMSAFAERDRFTRPRRMSSCASRSPSCHPAVQKYACEASMSCLRRRTISSAPRTSATKTSPSVAPILLRRSDGSVSCPFRRRVMTSDASAIASYVITKFA